MEKDDIAKMSFEIALKELESVVDALETGEAPLDRAVALFERGAELRKHCQTKLKEAELRLDRILGDDKTSSASRQSEGK